MGMITAAGACALIDIGGPAAGVARLISEAGQRAAQPVVAGPSEGDRAVLARLIGHGSDTRLGGELRFGGEALANGSELGKDLC